ncbi:MAG: THUMP domain-containing protein, partial [Candidatus Aenigmatarchaeota archaeon]
VKKITNSPVDLENPDIEINIECRSRKAYIFTEKYECAGGLPLGTAGKVCVVMNNKKTMIEAAWLLARKGCELILIFEKDNKNFEDSLKILNKWYYGREIKYYFYDKLKFLEEINSIAEKENALAIVFPDNFQKITLKDIEKINIENKNIKFPILRPIIFMRKNELKKLKNKIFLPLKNE